MNPGHFQRTNHDNRLNGDGNNQRNPWRDEMGQTIIGSKTRRHTEHQNDGYGPNPQHTDKQSLYAVDEVAHAS